jgi:hypothetical protein
MKPTEQIFPFLHLKYLNKLTKTCSTVLLKNELTLLYSFEDFCLSGLAILSIEKDAVHQLKSTATFYDDVITEFTKQERRMDFTFK